MDMNDEMKRALLEAIRSGLAERVGMAELPESVRKMLEEANANGAEMFAMTKGDMEKLPAPLRDILLAAADSGLTLEQSPYRDLSDPRYALTHTIAKEFKEREFEFERLHRTPLHHFKAVDGNLRLYAMHYAQIVNLQEGCDMMKQVTGKNASVVVRSLLAILQTLGFTNIFDAMKSGPERLYWHGMTVETLEALLVLFQNIGATISKATGIPGEEVMAMLDEMTESEPLSPLPPEKIYHDDFNADIWRNLATEMVEQDVLDKLVAAGFTGMKVMMDKTDDISDLQKQAGINDAEREALLTLFAKMEGVSFEASNGMTEAGAEASKRKQEEALAEKSRSEPVVSPKDPIVRAILGTNLATTLEIADIVDLHHMTPLRATQHGNDLAGELSTEQRKLIADACMVMSPCDCKGCTAVRADYFKAHPDIKRMIDIRNKPTLH